MIHFFAYERGQWVALGADLRKGSKPSEERNNEQLYNCLLQDVI